jgi:hypothetical protein
VSNLTRAVAAVKLAAKAHAPTMMVVGGVVSMGASVIMASKQTLKVEEVLEKHVVNLEKIQKGTDLGQGSYTPDVAAKDRITVYSQVGWDLGKLYAVPGVLFFGGAALVFGGHHIMLKRNAGLALAFTAVSEAFEKYRENVRQVKGDEFDQAMMNGYVTKEVYDDVTGKTETITTRDWDGSPNADPYNRVFECGATPQWEPDLAVNRMFVEQVQRMMQRRLINENHLYLSDVYKHLGFPESDVSRVCGWKVARNEDGSRNIPEVDFGLNKPMPDDWKYSKEAAIYLDFNCHGLIVGGAVQKALEKSR